MSLWQCWSNPYEELRDEDQAQPIDEILPAELFEHILLLLPVSELFTCSQVSQSWYNTLNQVHVLQSLKEEIERSHKIILLGKPSWLWSEATFSQREKMSKDLDLFYFSNESKVTDFLRKICFDRIKYSNSICGWQREYFIRVFYNKIHYHLNIRVVAYPKEFHSDVPPNACTFLLASNISSQRFLRRSRRHIKREVKFIPIDELNIVDIKFLVSSRRSELKINVRSEEIFSEAHLSSSYRSREDRRSSLGTDDRYSKSGSDLQEVVVLPEEEILEYASEIDFIWNKKEGINNQCLHSFVKYLIDTMADKAKVLSPETFEEEANRIIQRQDRVTDLRMTAEAIAIGCLGNFLYPIFLLPFCFFFDICCDPLKSDCPYVVSVLLGVLRFAESIVALLLFTVFGVWGSIVGTAVYNYGFVLAVKHLVPKEKPAQCRIFSESGWFE